MTFTSIDYEKFRALRVTHVATRLEELIADEANDELTPEQLFLTAVDDALEQRRAHKVEKLTRQAGFPIPHASISEIDYREGRPEELLAEGVGRFDAVIALEVIEHVADREGFCRHLAGLVKPRGPVFVSTLNRTPRSWLLAKFGAICVILVLNFASYRYVVWPAERRDEGRAAESLSSDPRP